jgi:hypothetical protein
MCSTLRLLSLKNPWKGATSNTKVMKMNLMSLLSQMSRRRSFVGYDEGRMSSSLDQLVRAATFFFRRKSQILAHKGTGKSYLVKAIIKALRQDGVSRIVKTATTGIAALNIRGETIHRWSGVGWAKRKIEFLVAAVCANRGATTRWREAEVLIIDESELGSSLGSKD